MKYDKKSGLYIVVNLFIIKYAYRKAKKHKSFIIDDGTAKVGRKQKHEELFGSILPISRIRFGRMKSGCNFELSVEEVEKICDTFGIDERYFTESDKCLCLIAGVKEEEWKKILDGEISLDNDNPDNKSGRSVAYTINDKINRKWERKLDETDPMYPILYYFTYGERCNKPRGAKMAVELLENLSFTEWNDKSMEELKQAHALMKKHYKYLDSLITIKTMK